MMKLVMYCPKTCQQIDINTSAEYHDLVLRTDAGTAPIKLRVDKSGVSIFVTDKDKPGIVKMTGIVVDGDFGIRFNTDTEVERLHPPLKGNA